jgi:hypothetical protein
VKAVGYFIMCLGTLIYFSTWVERPETVLQQIYFAQRAHLGALVCILGAIFAAKEERS